MYCRMYDVPLSQQNVVSTTGVATVGDADMKLRKCVNWNQSAGRVWYDYCKFQGVRRKPCTLSPFWW